MITLPSVGPWYSTEEAAEAMGMTPGHISRKCKLNEFDHQKVGNSYILHNSVVKQLPENEYNITDTANHFHRQLKEELRREKYQNKPRILGVLSKETNDEASLVYAKTLKKICDTVGFELGTVENKLSEIKEKISKANNDNSIHGIFVFYPIFGDERDKEIKEMINPSKDIEGLSSFWSDKLYSNTRYIEDDINKKSILPCTSLGILKSLVDVDSLDERIGKTFSRKKITIFNRSDVVGQPLAYMLKNDGATVYSFDIDGGIVMEKDKLNQSISREEALSQSDIIITGVPSKSFEKVRGEEIIDNTTCINFSFIQNFEQCAKEKAGVYVPRVGPMTLAMCIRNAIRLYKNNREVYEADNQSASSTFSWEEYGLVINLAA